ncbi:MAG: lipoate--protein ligase, partial [Pseudonocardiales bacterium]|nr:lipoate--protein ligase [Pseudonocardiales bacterium]
MHGEFKVPGGKLVVVDLDVVDGVLRDVAVAGDFFLEPDEALGAINAALTGAPADASALDLTARVTAALPRTAVLYGFSAADVATAVRRALAEAT